MDMSYYIVESKDAALDWDDQILTIANKYSKLLFKQHTWELFNRSFVIVDCARTFLSSDIHVGRQSKILTRSYFTRNLSPPKHELTIHANITINLIDRYTMVLPMYDKIHSIFIDNIINQLILFTNNDLLRPGEKEPFSMFYLTPRCSEHTIMLSIDNNNARSANARNRKPCAICGHSFGDMASAYYNVLYHFGCVNKSKNPIQCQSSDTYVLKEVLPNGLMIYQSASTKIITIFAPYGIDLTDIMPKILSKYYAKIRIFSYILL